MKTLSVEIRVQKPNFSLEISQEFDLDSGIFGIFGVSGSGKTTLLRAIAGLDKKVQGRIIFNDEVWLDNHYYVEPHRRGARMVFQEGRLFDHLSVRKNLIFGLRRSQQRQPEIDFDSLIETLGLYPLLSRGTGSLSGGEILRVAIGRAILASPKLLLLDEPLNSLDLERRLKVIELLENLYSQFRIPILYVSHDVNELAKLTTHLIVLKNGRAVAAGPTKSVLSRLDLFQVADVIEPSSIVDGRVLRHEKDHGLSIVTFAGKNLHIPTVGLEEGSKVRLRFLASDVAIALKKPERISIRNIFPGKIIDIKIEKGAFVYVSIDIGGVVILSRITRKSSSELQLFEGVRVFSLVKTAVLQRSI